MSITNLIGWLSLPVLLVVLFLLYRFITSPANRLEKLLGDGMSVGLTRVRGGSFETEKVKYLLAGVLGTDDKNLRICALYRTQTRDAYLLSVIRSWKGPRPGGKTTEHEGTDCFFLLEPTKLRRGFVVTLRPDFNVAGSLARLTLEKFGVDVDSHQHGALSEFSKHFITSSGGDPIPELVQNVFIRHAQQSEQYWDVLQFLEGQGKVICTPQHLLTVLSRINRPKTEEHIQTILAFTRELAEQVRAY